ncbi:MAG: hypothetical protein JSV84_14450 [Gemmatimonadota bacterium]|nr:MAG: hypothetical protein JSV84_14450 [Gemmatimonadota bacterium]
MKKRILAVSIVSIVMILIAHAETSEIPQLISFQGKLFDTSGSPLTGDHEITFRIYNAAEGGTALWSETSTVSCTNGLYNVILGLTTPITLDFDGNYWIGVQVAGAGELYPRYRIVSVPVAFRAAVADSATRSGYLDGKGSGDFADTSHTHDGADITSGTIGTDRLHMGPGSGLNADLVDGKHAHEMGGGSVHDHWGESWEGEETGLDLFALNDGTALDACSEDGYAIEARSGGTISVYGNTGNSGLQKLAAGVLGEGSSSHGIAGLSSNAAGVAGRSENESGVYGYSSSYRGVTGVSQDGTGVYGSSSGDYGVYGISQGGSGVYGHSASSGQKVSPAGVVGEGRHAPGVAGYSYDGYGLYGQSGENSPGVYGTSSGDSAIGVYGSGEGDYGYGVYGKHASTYGSYGGLGGLQHGVYGFSQAGAAVVGESGNLTEYGYYDVIGALANGDYLYGYGVFGAYEDLSGQLGSNEGYAGVYGRAESGVGVSGRSTNNMGVVGWSTHDTGVYGRSDNSYGVHGRSDGDAAVYAEGDLFVTGEYRGDIGPNNGAPFPRPAYDSGWRTIAQGETQTLNHNIGGDPDNYVVDLQFKGSSGGAHQMYYGLDWDTKDYSTGGYWRDLTVTSISVYRGGDDTTISKIRVRIWVYN